MPAFYQVEARKDRGAAKTDPMWKSVIGGDRPETVALSLTAPPTAFTTNQYRDVVATLVAKGYEVRLANYNG